MVSIHVLLLRCSQLFALKAYGICLVFLSCNITTQTGYYKKCINRLVANLLSYNITKYYKNWSILTE